MCVNCKQPGTHLGQFLARLLRQRTDGAVIQALRQPPCRPARKCGQLLFLRSRNPLTQPMTAGLVPKHCDTWWLFNKRSKCSYPAQQAVSQVMLHEAQRPASCCQTPYRKLRHSFVATGCYNQNLPESCTGCAASLHTARLSVVLKCVHALGS